MVEGRAYKTKLCVLYKRGHFPRHNCSFAHGTADLRPFSAPAAAAGKRDFRADDLRDKLNRRQSPRRTFSPRRDEENARFMPYKVTREVKEAPEKAAV